MRNENDEPRKRNGIAVPTATRRKRARRNRVGATIVAAWAAHAVGSSPQQARRVELEDRTPTAVRSENPAADLSVLLEADPVQTQAARGLRFAVVIANKGDAPVELTDLSQKTDDICEYMLIFWLFNEEGTRVELPRTRCVTQVDTTDPVRERAEWISRRQVERTEEARRPGSGRVKTPADADDGTVVLAPDQEYRLPYRVTHILAEPKEQERRRNALLKSEARPGEWDMERPPMERIPPARYRISLEVRVRGRVGDQEFRRYFELASPIDAQLGD